MEEWDKNQWQGKRKKQVDYTHTVGFFSVLLFILMLISSIISVLFLN